MTTIGVEKATELGPKDFERLVLRAVTSMKNEAVVERGGIRDTGHAESRGRSRIGRDPERR
jgi:hypothetical protein